MKKKINFAEVAIRPMWTPGRKTVRTRRMKHKHMAEENLSRFHFRTDLTEFLRQPDIRADDIFVCARFDRSADHVRLEPVVEGSVPDGSSGTVATVLFHSWKVSAGLLHMEEGSNIGVLTFRKPGLFYPTILSNRRGDLVVTSHYGLQMFRLSTKVVDDRETA